MFFVNPRNSKRQALAKWPRMHWVPIPVQNIVYQTVLMRDKNNVKHTNLVGGRKRRNCCERPAPRSVIMRNKMQISQTVYQASTLPVIQWGNAVRKSAETRCLGGRNGQIFAQVRFMFRVLWGVPTEPRRENFSEHRHFVSFAWTFYFLSKKRGLIHIREIGGNKRGHCFCSVIFLPVSVHRSLSQRHFDLHIVSVHSLV